MTVMAMDNTGKQAARAGADITIAVHRETDFDVAGEAYRGLYERADATAFQDPRWLARFYRDLVPHRGAEPVFITGRAADGALIFVLPLTLRTVSGCRLLEAADLGVCDYCAPVVDRAWIDWLRTHRDLHAEIAAALPAHDVLRIRNIRDEFRSAWALFFKAAAKRLDFSAHEAALDNDYATWRSEALTKSFTKYLNRRKNRFLKSGTVELTRLDDPAQITAAIDALATLRLGRFDGDMIQQEPVHAFYAGIAADSARDDFAATYALTFDDAPVGYVFGVTANGRFHYLLIGCDYEQYGRHSPGLVMYDMIIEDWIKAGGTVFDFTIGDEAFKADFGTRAIPIYGIQAARTVSGRLALAAHEAGATLRKLRARDWRAKT